MDPEILHMCLMCPCQALSDLLFGWKSNIWRKITKHIRKRLGRGTVNTTTYVRECKFQGHSLKTGVDIGL